MQRRHFLTAACAAASTAALGATEEAFAQDAPPAPAATVLRVGTLAPKGSSWMRVFDAWNNTLKQESGGRLELHFYSGGAAGDERDAVRKMRAGQLDAAVVTTMGLGQIVRSCMVLQAPGVCHNYARIDAVRNQLAGEFEAQFAGAGYKLVGWGDAGQGRVFSNKKVFGPQDMQGTRMWSWRDDPTWQSVLTAAEVSGVELGLPEVYPALRTNRIDAFPATAIAAVAFQWYTKAAFVTREPRGIVVGATVVKKEKFDALPGDLQTILVDTGRTAHAALQTVIRQDDQKALDAILARGVEAVSTSANVQAWDDVLRRARQSLVGRLYPADLLARVEQIAAAAG